MMAEDWDLFAIVQSCQSATNTAATTEENPLTTTNSIPLPHSISTSTVKEELRFSFPNSNNIMQPTITNDLQELNQFFTTTRSGPAGINLNVPQPLEEASTSNNNINKFHDQQEFHVPQSISSTVVVQHQQLLTPLSRKRKSQQGRMVCHVTADNLSADLWAWRKYGQKPIKGSPFPRNYYRCSSSKGCTARKQVEQSNTEAHIFIVTYTGDHPHPRPTHRNSLAGSTRNKSLGMHPPTSASLSLRPNTTASTSSSAPNSPENHLCP